MSTPYYLSVVYGCIIKTDNLIGYKQFLETKKKQYNVNSTEPTDFCTIEYNSQLSCDLIDYINDLIDEEILIIDPSGESNFGYFYDYNNQKYDEYVLVGCRNEHSISDDDKRLTGIINMKSFDISGEEKQMVRDIVSKIVVNKQNLIFELYLHGIEG